MEKVGMIFSKLFDNILSHNHTLARSNSTYGKFYDFKNETFNEGSLRSNLKYSFRLTNAREHSPYGELYLQLVSSLTRLELTKEENMLIMTCSEAVESKLVKLQTSCTVVLPKQILV